ncbi:MAG: hypothetical protein WKG52_09795 [Variovorax sp.]
MAAEHENLTPQQRLALSRKALVYQLQGGRPAPRASDAASASPSDRPAGLLDHFAWTSVARSMTQRWWRRHPANAVGQLARPLLDRYARDQPVKLVTAAATIGVLVVLVKPWRLLSVTALLAALLKTSDIADIVTALMHKRSN